MTYIPKVDSGFGEMGYIYLVIYHCHLLGDKNLMNLP